MVALVVIIIIYFFLGKRKAIMTMKILCCFFFGISDSVLLPRLSSAHRAGRLLRLLEMPGR